MKSRWLISLSILIGACLFSSPTSLLQAQNIKSETASFHLNNIPDKDTLPPEVRIVNLSFDQDSSYISHESPLDLVLRVSDESRISFVRVNRSVPIEAEPGVYFPRIDLRPGNNELKVMAMDAQENLINLNYTIIYEPPVVTLADKIRFGSTYYGLLIGINNYKDESLEDLDHPQADADDLYRVLTKYYHFDKKNTIKLKNPTRNDIIRELNILRSKITPSDNLIIFYAGHGYYDSIANTGYWLPADASRLNSANWFENTTLTNQLRGIQSKHTLVITDACYAGSITKSRSVDLRLERKFEMDYEEPSRRALTSGNMTEVPDKSAFIEYLIKYLIQNQSEYFSAEELYTKLRDPVIYANEIRPIYGVIPNTGSQDGHFIFLRDLTIK